ncbi:MAG: hypothetical protein U5O39_13080 [Gammaproteobacteria bacterium]|nr:hypothetical protein [Gammaproteobacteria bacterium]
MWAAVRYFDVDTEVVWVLFVMSFIFVFGMIFVGLALSLLLRLFRRKPSGMLDHIEEKEGMEPTLSAGHA